MSNMNFKKVLMDSVILILRFYFFPMIYIGMCYFCVSEHSCEYFIILVLKLVNEYVSLCCVVLCQINETELL